jgi:pimeloyl-ACP methyl ester carboxylesterase
MRRADRPLGAVIRVSTALILMVGVSLFAAPSQVDADTSYVPHPLPRSGYLGVGFSPAGPSQPGLRVTQIRDADAAARTGLQTGDILVAIDGRPIADSDALAGVRRHLHAGDSVKIEVLRAGKPVTLTVASMPGLPGENLPGTEVIHDSVSTGDGTAVSMVVTRPLHARGRLPVVFLVGWLSCDSVEYPFGAGDGFGQLMLDIASRSGYVLVRMDKPGVGDSTGPECRDLDFDTELAAYRKAFDAMSRYPFVDMRRIVVLGLSNGGGYAPLVAGNHRVAGYVISGGWVKTWYEHMLEMERRRLLLSGVAAEEIAPDMAAFAEFYTAYLIEEKTPAQVIETQPRMKALWYDEPDHQYGRPAAFYQQLQKLNLLALWSAVDAPVLSLHGEYDSIMSREDHQIIADLVNAKHPGYARFMELPGLNHVLFKYSSPVSAFNFDSSGHYDPRTSDIVIDFLKQTLEKTH